MLAYVPVAGPIGKECGFTNPIACVSVGVASMASANFTVTCWQDPLARGVASLALAEVACVAVGVASMASANGKFHSRMLAGPIGKGCGYTSPS